MNLSALWFTYVNELKAMFEQDNDISIRYDDENKEAKIYVAKASKADALAKILKSEKEFGNIKLKITVVPPNENDFDILDLFDDAFNGNPALSFVMPIESPIGKHRYVVFKNKVVQFYNDQLDDLNGNKSTLFQDIAKDIFEDKLMVNYCTETVDRNLIKPLGEWP